MGSPQTAPYSVNPVAGFPGCWATCQTKDADTHFVDASETAGIPPGTLAVRHGVTGEAALPAALAADPDAVIATGGSTAGIQTLTASSFDGDVGADSIALPAAVTMTISSSADWDATTAVLTAVDQNGQTVTENLSISDAGNEVLTTTGFYTRVIQLVIPAQSGTNGTFTLGFAATSVTTPLTAATVLGVSMLDKSKEGPDVNNQPNREAAFAVRGDLWVTTDQQAVVGQRPYVRIVASASEQLGVFRADADGTDAVPVDGARFVEAPSATLARLRVDFAG